MPSERPARPRARPPLRAARAAALPAPPAAGRLAAIDIGSNSIHMVVVEPDGHGGYRVLDREREIVRLGSSALGPERRLSARARRDGLEALRKMTTLARLKGTERFVAVATSAVREAENGEEFLAEVAEQTGLRVRLLHGEEEARLIWRAVRETVDLDRGRFLIADIGGGSTEWIVSHEGRLESARSLPLGSLRLHHLLASDPPAPRELQRLRRRIARALETLPRPRPLDGMIATSGTANCAADLAAWYAGRSQRAGGGTVRALDLADLDEVVRRLVPLSRRQVAALPPVGPGRAPSILPGAVLLAALARHAGVDRITVSDRALREGIVLEELGAPEPVAGRGDLRRRQVLALASRAESVLSHSRKTAELALRLFDLTARLHGLGEREREWLEHAALLHDIGYAIHYRGHHKHSQYLIESAALDAFDPQEVAVLAQVARYHRGARPKPGHAGFAALRPWQQRVVVRLAALLRVADALDRTHAGRIERLHAVIRRRRLRLEVTSPYDVRIEIAAAHERRRLFERTFDRRLELRQALAAAPETLVAPESR